MKRTLLKTLLANEAISEEARVELKKLLVNKSTVLPGWSTAFLKRLGNIETVIDVGVLNGTPSLYKAYPDAKLYLFEALPMYEQACAQIIKDHPGGGAHHMIALGESQGTTTFRYYEDDPRKSSAVTSVVDKSLVATEIEVPLKRLDSILNKSLLVGDTLLKVDTEGYECHVIRGAAGILPHIKYCITESSIRKRHEDSYRFADLIALMKENGFDLYDVLTVTRAGPGIPKASIMDALFINSRYAE
jgi:FkbM family methyltransferase